jgi:hypothetical protein
MKTFHLFIDDEFCIRNVFEILQMNIFEPGIMYIEIKEQGSILPPYIVMKTIYKAQYLLDKVAEQLEDINYDKSFEILKPLFK